MERLWPSWLCQMQLFSRWPKSEFYSMLCCENWASPSVLSVCMPMAFVKEWPHYEIGGPGSLSFQCHCVPPEVAIIWGELWMYLQGILHSQGCVRHSPWAGRWQLDLVEGCDSLEWQQVAEKNKFESLELYSHLYSSNCLLFLVSIH